CVGGGRGAVAGRGPARPLRGGPPDRAGGVRGHGAPRPHHHLPAADLRDVRVGRRRGGRGADDRHPRDRPPLRHRRRPPRRAGLGVTGRHNDDKEARMVRPIDGALTLAENVLYTVAAVLLLVGAVAVLGEITVDLVQELDDGVARAVTHALDGLLLVFILLELLAAVRATMVEHRLVAEPFLVAGIIASIKEIIVLSLEAETFVGKPGEGFSDAM